MARARVPSLYLPTPGTHRVVSWLMLVKEELLKELILLLLKSLEETKASLLRGKERNPSNPCNPQLSARGSSPPLLPSLRWQLGGGQQGGRGPPPAPRAPPASQGCLSPPPPPPLPPQPRQRGPGFCPLAQWECSHQGEGLPPDFQTQRLLCASSPSGTFHRLLP